MVLCELVVGDDDHEQRQKQAMKAPPPPLVEVLRVSCGLLYCQQKFYVIDPTMPKFDEKRICQVNPQEDGLYTMHYVTLVSGNGDLTFRDGPVAETWHERWRPTLRELMAFVLQEADMMPPWLFRQRAVFDGLLRPHLSVAKVLLLLGAGSAPEAAVGDGGEANPSKKRQKKQVVLAMETKKAKRESEEPLDAQVVPTTTTTTETGKQAAADTPQMARMALVLESAVVNAIELIEVAAEMPVEACPVVVLATSLQQSGMAELMASSVQ
jgi:hypothetical protein